MLLPCNLKKIEFIQQMFNNNNNNNIYNLKLYETSSSGNEFFFPAAGHAERHDETYGSFSYVFLFLKVSEIK